jgi:hypothetical protein
MAALDGATQIARYRWQQPGEDEVQRYANCRIPRTVEALQMLDQRFRATERRRYAGAGGSNGDVVTILDTTTPIGGGGGGDGEGCDWNDCDTSGGIGGGTATGGEYGDPGDPGEVSRIDDGDAVEYDEPDCSQPPTTNYAAAFCRSAEPDITGPRWTLTETALQRIRARGGACAEIADQGLMMLRTGRIRYFSPMPGDAGAWGELNGGILLADYWVIKYATSQTTEVPPRNLDQTLVHEIDHVNGLRHLADPLETPNSRFCSGI